MFHAVRAVDDPTIWLPMRDYINASPGYAVSQNSPATVGISESKWAQRISTDWDFNGSENDGLAAEAFAARINAITQAGRICVVDEIKGAGAVGVVLPMISLSIPLLEEPTKVYFYVVNGRYVSYENLDSADEYPVLSNLLEAGCGLLPEIYISQALAERSGDIIGFIDKWYRGPGDGKMPYLSAIKRELSSDSPIHFIYPVVDRFFKGERRLKMKRARFLDLVMQRGFLQYPNVFRAGVGTWIWDSTRITKPERAGDVVSLLNHYQAGPGLASAGKRRFYTAETR